MLFSKSFIKTKRENPSNATIYSHIMMLRAGFIDQSCAGIYNWLPLGLKVLNKISKIVREEHDRSGCCEILVSTLQPASVWEKSKRINDYGKELLRISDRHEAELLYGPTAEEAVTEFFHNYVKSYKDLPKILYNIQWKFRDEIRPRHGLMRGREFLMSDAYSFDVDEKSAIESYKTMFSTLVRIFQRIGLPFVPVKAASGAIGGNYSHEFHMFAPEGDSEIFYKREFDSIVKNGNFTLDDVQNGCFVSNEKTDEIDDIDDKNKYHSFRSIEVGHNFYFGEKYTESMECYLQDYDGNRFHAKMGSYGVGVSRLVAAIVESSHDEKGVLWPRSVNPFEVILINAHANDEAAKNYGYEIYEDLLQSGVDIGYDDRDISYGQKMQDAYLIGACYIVVFGKNDVSSQEVRVISRFPLNQCKTGYENSFENFDKNVSVKDLKKIIINN